MSSSSSDTTTSDWTTALKPGDIIRHFENKDRYVVVWNHGKVVDFVDYNVVCTTSIEALRRIYYRDTDIDSKPYTAAQPDLLQSTPYGNIVCGNVKIGAFYRAKLDRCICKVEAVHVEQVNVFVLFKTVGSAETHRYNLTLFKNSYIPIKAVDIDNTTTP
jgi:hypothetical protein